LEISQNVSVFHVIYFIICVQQTGASIVLEVFLSPFLKIGVIIALFYSLVISHAGIYVVKIESTE
jgi:hypothetical protein